ncbi:MAG TPA: hypothetical protein ACFYD6_12030 [Candidatus Brocadiia bacterium]|nr:hypothetical protein [Candidatus Brocadiales bacterium]
MSKKTYILVIVMCFLFSSVATFAAEPSEQKGRIVQKPAVISPALEAKFEILASKLRKIEDVLNRKLYTRRDARDLNQAICEYSTVFFDAKDEAAKAGAIKAFKLATVSHGSVFERLRSKAKVMDKQIMTGQLDESRTTFKNDAPEKSCQQKYYDCIEKCCRICNECMVGCGSELLDCIKKEGEGGGEGGREGGGRWEIKRNLEDLVK